MAKSQAMEPVDPSMATLVQVFLKNKEDGNEKQ
jgi:hypothetical protein